MSARRVSDVVPEAGMGATNVCYSDREAYTIVEVLTPRKIIVQRDKATRTDSNGMSEMQKYNFESDPNAPKVVVTKRKDGRWLRQKTDHDVFVIGSRQEYYDFSF